MASAPAEPRSVAMWSVAFHALKDSPWEEEDERAAAQASTSWPEVELSGPAAALRAAYAGPLGGKPDNVRAALIACARTFGSAYSVDQFQAMAAGFLCRYDGMREAVQDWLDDQYGRGLRAEWFREDAPVWQAPVKEDEVWVAGSEFHNVPDDDRETDQYVFARPRR